MNPLVYHVASGQVFFTGSGLVIIAALLSTRADAISKRLTILAFLIGAVGILLSSTAIPYWLYCVAGLVMIVWISSVFVPRWQKWSPYAVIAVWALAAVVEIPYLFCPALQPVTPRRMAVIADSITAGTGSNDHAERWPVILAREHGIVILDLSHPGET